MFYNRYEKELLKIKLDGWMLDEGSRMSRDIGMLSTSDKKKKIEKYRVNVHMGDLSKLATYYPFVISFLSCGNLWSSIKISYYMKSLKGNQVRKRKKLESNMEEMSGKSGKKEGGVKSHSSVKDRSLSVDFARNISNSLERNFYYFLKRNNLLISKGWSGSRGGRFPCYIILNLKIRKWKGLVEWTSEIENAVLIKDRKALKELSAGLKKEERKSGYNFPLCSDIVDIKLYELITNSLEIPLDESESNLLAYWTNFMANPLVYLTYNMEEK